MGNNYDLPMSIYVEIYQRKNLNYKVKCENKIVCEQVSWNKTIKEIDE